MKGFSLFSKRPKAISLAFFCSLDIYILWAVTLFACMFAVIRAHKIDSALSHTINQILLCFAIFQSAAEHSSCVWKKHRHRRLQYSFSFAAADTGPWISNSNSPCPKYNFPNRNIKGEDNYIFVFAVTSHMHILLRHLQNDKIVHNQPIIIFGIKEIDKI